MVSSSGGRSTLLGHQRDFKWERKSKELEMRVVVGGEDRAHETGEKGFVGPINVLCPPPPPLSVKPCPTRHLNLMWLRGRLSVSWCFDHGKPIRIRDFPPKCHIPPLNQTIASSQFLRGKKGWGGAVLRFSAALPKRASAFHACRSFYGGLAPSQELLPSSFFHCFVSHPQIRSPTQKPHFRRPTPDKNKVRS